MRGPSLKITLIPPAKDSVAVYIKPEYLKDLKIPSGNEVGVNQYWIPGGYTKGGIAEAVMNFSHKPPYQEFNFPRR